MSQNISKRIGNRFGFNIGQGDSSMRITSRPKPLQPSKMLPLEKESKIDVPGAQDISEPQGDLKQLETPVISDLDEALKLLEESKKMMLQLHAENSTYKMQLAAANRKIKRLSGYIAIARNMLRRYRISYHGEWNARASAMVALRKLQKKLFNDKYECRLMWHFSTDLYPHDPNADPTGGCASLALGWCNLEQFPVEDPDNPQLIIEHSWRRRADTGRICVSDDKAVMPELVGNPGLEQEYAQFLIRTNDLQRLLETEYSDYTEEYLDVARIERWLDGQPDEPNAYEYQYPSSVTSLEDYDQLFEVSGE